MADIAHPRMHALTMASATHLRNQGHISPAQHSTIKRKAKGQMKVKPPATFGALAPPEPDRDGV